MFQTPKIFSQLGGESGIYQTVAMMIQIVNESFLHPYIRERAANLAGHCARSLNCEHLALLGWVNSRMNFIQDPYGVESLFHPINVEENLRSSDTNVPGDCDDMAMYLAALLKSIGHNPAFRVIGKNSSQLHHVMVNCHRQNLDPTVGRIVDDPVAREMFFPIE